MQFAAALDATSPVRPLASNAAGIVDPLARARHVVRAVVADPAALAGLPLARKEGGYARNFLFGDETMSVWAMVWAAGCATSVHDHHCSCCFGILSGALVERWFRPIGDDRVVATHEAVRAPGFSACMVPSGPNIHQMLNLSDREAISIHVYGFDTARHASSVEREYVVARG